MGQPSILNRILASDEYIVRRGDTRGSETSQYPKEKKSIDMAQVVASESVECPNQRACSLGLRDREKGNERS